MDVSNRSLNALRIVNNGTRSVANLIKLGRMKEAAQMSAKITAILKTISKQRKKKVKFD